MKPSLFHRFLRKIVPPALIIGGFWLSASAQISTQPQRFQLLNGLRVLLISRPGDQDVLLKLRIHSGAAFDLASKGGTMALLGDLLFPDPATREYFTDEMQGRLNVVTDYDSLTITMKGRAQAFEQIAEILRTALVTTQLTPENVAKAREGRIKVIRDTSISPAMLADRTIASRLFGDFPYGRPYGGTVESVERIERADLMLARERFLNPNNATLVIIGGIERPRANRTLRQLLGAWRKSEQIVPATFRQPSVPDQRTLLLNVANDQSAEVRVALRGFARNDPDEQAANLLALIALSRWQQLLPDLAKSPTFVRHETFTLPGIFVMGAGIDNLLADKALVTAQETIKSFATQPITDAELEAARGQAIANLSKQLGTPEGIADAWLDVETYAVKSGSEQMIALASISANDLKRAANRLFWKVPMASAVVGSSELLKPQLERHGKLELIGEVAPAAKEADGKTQKPQSKSSDKPW